MRFLLLYAAVALGLPAITATSVAEATEPGRPAAAAYRFVPSDVLEITVSSHTGYDRTVTIPPDGRIHVPLVGEIDAAGLTAPELAERIRKGLTAELVDPRVTVSLKELNHGQLRRISVLGAVKNPGVFELKEQSTPAEMLATAGGPTGVADLRRVALIRAAGGPAVTLDLARLTNAAPPGERVELAAGDVLVVPEGTPRTVLVLGEAAKPGSYELVGEMRLLDALSQAGGPTPRADLQHVRLLRAGQEKQQTLDLEALIAARQPQDAGTNVLLQPGDAIVLPQTEEKYYVLGEVNKADAYPVKPNDRLLDAITMAGGSTREADLARVMLVRKDPQGQPIARRLNLKRMVQNGDMSRNELLRPGDVVFVPNRKPTRTLSEYLGLLYPLSSLLNVLRF